MTDPKALAVRLRNDISNADFDLNSDKMVELIESLLRDALEDAKHEGFEEEGVGCDEHCQKARAEAYADAAKIAEAVADADADCLPGCDNNAHEELCPLVNPVGIVIATPTLCLHKAVVDFIVSESASRSPVETGGILVGRTGPDGIHVTQALGPGPEAQHHPSRFQRDGQYAQQKLDEIFTLTDGQEDYVGEWHSHPTQCGASSLDFNSMDWVSQNNAYSCTSPILIVSCPARDGGWELLPYTSVRRRMKRCANYHLE